MEPGAVELDFRRFRDAGDVGALARVFEAAAPELLRAATALCGDPVRGEDLLQATFVTAIERRTAWDDARPLVPWLVGILGRHARAAERRARRTPEPDRLSVPEVPDPRLAAETAEQDRGLARRLDRLGEPLREVVVLHLRHGLAPAEIADALGRSPSTVRTQLRRGLSRLRESLPRGVAPALLALPRGLSSVERRVLEHAHRSVPGPAASPAASSPSPIGALMLKSALVLVPLAVSLLLVTDAPGDEPAVLPLRAAAASGPVGSARSALRAPSRPARVEPRSEAPAPPRGDDRERALPTFRPLWIEVVDPIGAPVVGARVALTGVRLAEEPDSLYGWRACVVAPGETDESGTTRLAVPTTWQEKHPDAISFRVDHPEFAPRCSDLVELREVRTRIALEWGSSLEVTGRIAGAPEALPAGLVAELGERSEVDRGDWIDLGDARLATNGLAPGAHQLALSATGPGGRRYRSAIESVALAPGERLSVRLELLPAASLVGRLSADVPRPVGGGEVVAHQSHGKERLLARTLRAPIAADGSFALDDLGPGILELAVLCDGWTSVDLGTAGPLASEAPGPWRAGCRHPAVEIDGRDLELVVPMTRTATLDVTARGPEGEPVADAHLGVRAILDWRDGRWSYFEGSPSGVTDERGLARVESVPPGAHGLMLFHPDYRIEGPIPLTSEGPIGVEPLRPGELRSVELALVAR